MKTKRKSIPPHWILDPIICTIVSASLTHWMVTHPEKVTEVLCGDRTTLYGPLASVFGALLGFTIAAFSIVLGFTSNDRMRPILNSGVLSSVWKVFVRASFWCAGATVMPISCLVLDRSGAPNAYLLGVLAFTIFSSIASIGRSIELLAAVGRLITSRLQSSASPAP